MSRRKGKRSGWRSPARKPTPPVRVRPNNEPSDLAQTRAVAEEIIELAEHQAQADGVLVGVLWDLIATMAIDRAGLTKEIADIRSSISPEKEPVSTSNSAATQNRSSSMATEKQVNYALALLDKAGHSTKYMNASFDKLGAAMRQRSGTVMAWLEAMDKHEISSLIDKLKGGGK